MTKLLIFPQQTHGIMDELVSTYLANDRIIFKWRNVIVETRAPVILRR